MRSVAELKNLVGQHIRLCLNHEKDFIFGGAVRDWVSESSFANVKDFDIFLHRSSSDINRFRNDLLGLLVSALGNEYWILSLGPCPESTYRIWKYFQNIIRKKFAQTKS